MEPASGEPIADSSEFKLLRAYCARRMKKKKSKRRSPFNEPLVEMGMSNKVQRRGQKGPIHEGQGPVALFHSGRGRTSDSHDDLGRVADKLSQIADNVSISSTALESDSGGEDTQPASYADPEEVIEKLVALLRSAGDELDGELQKNPALLRQLQSAFSYSVFERVAKTFLSCFLPSFSPASSFGSEHSSQQAQIAMTFELTSRLSALDVQPMNRVMGFGAHFLQQNFSGWVQQHGGWDKAFDGQAQDEDEVQ